MDSHGVIVSKTRPEKCPACGSKELRQDDDVLDTWFSSWLWPFSTLGWPQKTKELDYFYPTSTLVTAQEIIFFWVARMIMAGYFCMKQPPFRTVYIHGTVRDITGKKMSKSLGNIIDPLDIIREYGTDALRYTLVTATAIGQDVSLSEERFAAGRNFANKLWNATRFVLSQPSAVSHQPSADTSRTLTVPDRWILSRLQQTIKRVTTSLDQFLLNDAASALYDFLWHDFCDWYLEIAKIQLQTSDIGHRTSDMLIHVLETSLRLLHPIMPFITEEIWQHLTPVDSPQSIVHSIMKAPWPQAVNKLIDEEAETLFEQFQAVTVAIRNTKAELNVPLKTRPAVHLASGKAAVRAFFEQHQHLLKTLAAAGDIRVAASRAGVTQAAATVVDGVEVLIPLAGLVDPQKEQARLQQKIDELTRYIRQTDSRLKDAQFVAKAPADVVEQTKTKLAQAEDTRKKLTDLLALVQSM